MSDLGSQIRHYIDDVAPAISLDDVQRPAPVADDIPVASPSKSRARWLVAAAAVACIAVIGAALAMSGDDADQVEAGPGTTVPPSGDWSWLTTMGSEAPMPDVPDGWTTLDFEDLRFAVPEDWTVPISRSCAQPSSGWVIVSNGGESESSCSPEEPEPQSILTIEPAMDSPTEGEPVQIGTLSATRMPAFACSDCPPIYRLDNGFQVTVTGPEADRVLDTFTDSGVHRMQQEGPVADSAGRATVDFEGLSFLVPAEWATVDLPGSYSERETGDGMIEMSGRADPGSCGGAMFPTDTPPEVYLGSSPFAPRCPPWRDLNLEPGDGIWIRSVGVGLDPADGASTIGEPVARGHVNGLDITVVRVDRLGSRTPSPVIDLVVRHGDQVHWISLGVGLDTSVARSVLRSLQGTGVPTGGSDAPAPTSTGGSEPEDTASTDGSPSTSAPPTTIAAPDITFTYADGTVGSLEDFEGTPVVLGFFASWCGPCRSQLAVLQDTADEFGPAVSIIGIGTQDPSAAGFAAEQGVDFTIVSDPDPDGAALEAFDGSGLPLVVLIDADGAVKRELTGLVSTDQLRSAIEDALLG